MDHSYKKLLFIHGGGGTKSKWRKQILTSEYLIECVDLPGHGDNDEPLLSSIEDYASWLEEQIKEDVIVIGHSMGGLVGLQLSAISKRVKGLVFVASHFRIPVHQKIIDQMATGDFSDSFFYASYSKQIAPSLLEEERKEILLNPVSVAKLDLEVCDHYVGGKRALKSIDVPLLAIYGSEDRLLPSDAKEQLLRLKPDAQTIEIKYAGHYPMLEQPDQFNDVLLRFNEKIN